MFNRKKSEESHQSAEPMEASHVKKGSQPKGRPTPKRRDAEARRVRPIVPADRKEAKRRAKEQRDEAFKRQQKALETGDERYFPLRDQGRARRITRDYIDSRWTISEYMLPAFLVTVVVWFASAFILQNSSLAPFVFRAVMFFLYCLIIVSVLESLWVWRGAKKAILAKYPQEEIPRGSWYYTFSRMFMLRRWRSPKPRVKRGEFEA